MDFYQKMNELIVNCLPEKWGELAEVVNGFCGTEPAIWKLPLVGSQAVSGSQYGLDAVCAAVACSYIAIMLVDDMLDEASAMIPALSPSAFAQIRSTRFPISAAARREKVIRRMRRGSAPEMTS